MQTYITMRDIQITETNSFNTIVATKVGLTAAVIHAKIAYFIATNMRNGHQEEDGLFWTNLTNSQIQEQLPFLTPKQIRTATDILKQHKAVITKDTHKNGKYRTTWYTIDPRTMARYYPKLLENQVPSGADGLPYKAEGSALQGNTMCPTGQNINNTKHNNTRHNYTRQQENNNNYLFNNSSHAHTREDGTTVEHFCSPAEYHKWKPLLLRNLKLDKTSYDAIQELVSKYGEDKTIEYITYWQKDGEYYHTTLELIEKVDMKLRWETR